ncbi:MAG TPA: S41 family peptidase [Anaerolineales bacterium]|nr:S41 family peptidase [Anaerolineales bacterium]
MKIKRIVFGLLVFSLLACNFVTQMVVPPTITPTPTSTSTVTATIPPTVTPTGFAPAFIPPECKASPLATVPADILVQATPELEFTEISKAEQLKVLDDIGNVVRDVYVYPDFNGNNWNAIIAMHRARVEAGMDTRSFYDEMFLMIQDLGDDHSFFLSPAEVTETEAELKGDTKFVGVGVYGSPDYLTGELTVVATFPGSAAEYAGIQSHDKILLIDGHSIDQLFSYRLRGPECSTVIVRVQSPGGAPRDVMLMRYAVQGNILIDARLVTTADGSKIGYIFIPTFFDETIPEQIEKALEEFGKLDGLILDLRMNGGGSSSVIYPILEYFIEGELGKFVSREETRPLKIYANEIQNSQTVPLVVLVGEGTVSFGEIFAGVMQDSGRAKVVGETSLGNVEVLRGYTFDDGSQIWVASETFHSAFSDSDWEKSGIIPDVRASAEWNSFDFGNDPAIAASLKLFGHK